MIRKHLTQVIATGLVLVMAFSVVSIAKAQGNPHDTSQKVSICHRTNSVTHPYVRETVDSSSVDGNSGNDNGNGDHLFEHTGSVFDPNTNYPTPHNGDQWGDIIPPFDTNGQSYDGPSQTSLNWPDGQSIWENNCSVPGETPTFDLLSVTAICTGPDGLTRWEIEDPNNIDINFSWELYLAGGSPVQESGTGQVLANSSTIVETHTPGDVKLTVYWNDPADSEETLHVCTENQDAPVCEISESPTPSPESSTPPTASPSPTISPQILGTSAPRIASTSTALPITGGTDSSIYYLIILVSLYFIYYLKREGWARIG